MIVRALLKQIGAVAIFASVITLSTRAQAAPDQLDTLPGFKVEQVLAADKVVNGSWINLAVDGKGRLLLGGQRKHPITRVTLADGKVVKQEQLKLPISETMGILWAEGALYINGAGPGPAGKEVFGLFKLTDKDNDDQYETVEFLREWQGGAGEHGAHGIVLGKDKKLYIVCGNFVAVPADISPASPHKNYSDDLVLPRGEDGNGFGAGKQPPGGFVVRMDLDGKNAQLFAAGERNTYDIAFNADGELFGFDSDMEYDWGAPWYRPVRVFHATSGADQGFREGTAKWPEYYNDGLPAAVNIGIGCPTGVAFGYGAKFPEKYQRAYYILDWTYGRLIAVHMKPQGSTYTATWENFIAPKALKQIGGKKTPLNLTDVVIAPDGAMYFTIGGRNTGAALYRVTYTGTEPTTAVAGTDTEGAQARQLRHSLEAFHGRQDVKAVETAWPHLDSDDRFIRYAARIAIESQPVEQWKSLALAEAKPRAALTALLAVARLGGKDAQADLWHALEKIPASSLTPEMLMDKVRLLQVSIARQGKPAAEVARATLSELSPLFPAKDPAMNRELSQLLLALDAPDAVARTVKLLQDSKTQEEQLAYVLALRTITSGWTPELRREYFSWFPKEHKNGAHLGDIVKWFADAGTDYRDGASFPRFIGNFFNDAKKTLSPEETASLQPLLASYTPPGAKPAKPGRKPTLIKAWKMADLEPVLAQVSKGRNFDKGKAAFEIAQCAVCHKFGNDGGATGPDLTAVASRFSRRDILESIIEPSKVISEQFQNTILFLKDGDSIDGRILEDNKDTVVIGTNPLQPNEKKTIKKSDIDTRKPSKLSPMPEGVANVLTKDEVLDLIAYLESAGKKNHPDFAR